MPCGTILRQSPLPTASAFVGPSAYEVVPSHDALDSKHTADKRGEISRASTPLTVSVNVVSQPVRELLFYSSEEEDYESLPVVSDVNTFSDEGVVELPDLHDDMREWFPVVHMVPPPPPASKSVEAMRLWHLHLVRHPSYAECMQLAGCACPKMPCTRCEELDSRWVRDCEMWWKHLSHCMTQSGLNFRFLSASTWYPYSFTHSMRFTGTAEPACDITTKADMTLINYSLPPPPAFTLATEEYKAATNCQAAALRSFVAAMTVWWRKACEWAAAAQQRHSWISCPACTGRDTEDWWRQCEEWWAATAVRFRKEGERVPAGPRAKRTKRSKTQMHSSLTSEMDGTAVLSA